MKATGNVAVGADQSASKCKDTSTLGMLSAATALEEHSAQEELMKLAQADLGVPAGPMPRSGPQLHAPALPLCMTIATLVVLTVLVLRPCMQIYKKPSRRWQLRSR